MSKSDPFDCDYSDEESDGDDFEGCLHGVSWNEECEECEDEYGD